MAFVFKVQTILRPRVSQVAFQLHKLVVNPRLGPLSFFLLFFVSSKFMGIRVHVYLVSHVILRFFITLLHCSSKGRGESQRNIGSFAVHCKAHCSSGRSRRGLQSSYQ